MAISLVTGIFDLLAKNVFFIDLIMLPTVGLAVYAAYKGVSAMWKAMAENAGVGEALYKPSATTVRQRISLALRD